MDKDVLTPIILFSILGLMIIGLLVWYYYQQKTNRETQRHLSDRDLLRLIDGEPDQLVSPHQLRDKTELSLNEARSRLESLNKFGIMNRGTNSRGRFFYGLREPLEKTPPDLELSSDPFLTVEDLLHIFAAYDYRVTAQELIMATGLPLAVIKREMKYFEQQKIVQRLSRSDANGVMVKRFFVLQDPYRSDPDRFRAQAGKLDLEMREILTNNNLLV